MSSLIYSVKEAIINYSEALMPFNEVLPTIK